MRAAVLTAPGLFDLRDLPRPDPGPDQALIRVTRAGICGTGVHIWHGAYAADRLPLIPGHEFAGVVAGLGRDVRHLREGDRVTADINIGCGTCYWCARDEVLNCPEASQLGITRDGAFADYVVLPARLALPAPVACVVRAARKARVGFGQSVVVLGAGPIGNLHVQMLCLCGAAPIIVADLSPDRCAMARAVGADAAVSDPALLRETAIQMTAGRGADLVIESVGLPGLYALAFDLIRKGGHVAFFGSPGPGETVPVDILRTILEENSLKGSVARMGPDMADALTLPTYSRFDTAAFTGAVWPLDPIAAAFAGLADRPGDLKTQISLV